MTTTTQEAQDTSAIGVRRPRLDAGPKLTGSAGFG